MFAAAPPVRAGTIDRQAARQVFLTTVWISALLGMLAQVLVIVFVADRIGRSTP